MVKWYECRKCGTPVHSTQISRLCHICLAEKQWIEKLARSARQRGIQSDLTIEQWKRAVEYFHGLCAYCQEREWTLVEHFVPTVLGGNTTASNVVPACLICNRLKYNLHPDQVKGIPKEALERVRVFLDQQKLIANCP